MHPPAPPARTLAARSPLRQPQSLTKSLTGMLTRVVETSGVSLGLPRHTSLSAISLGVVVRLFRDSLTLQGVSPLSHSPLCPLK